MTERVAWDDNPELRARVAEDEDTFLKAEGKRKSKGNGFSADHGPVGKLTLKSGEGYKMQKISWIWPGWLASGKFHILGGQKGAGKSSIVIDLLATITSGGKWPDGTPAPPGDALIWSGEDDISDTILPRFVVAGGFLDRIFFIENVVVEGVKRAFDPAVDIPALLDAIRDKPNLSAIMIDPIVSATAGDSHKNSETRRGLQPLIDLAIERNIAIIGITHFTKGSQGTDPIERITGSLAFGAIPRVVWAAAKGDTEDTARRLVRIGSNIGATGGGYEYLLCQSQVPDHDFAAQRILWGNHLTGTPLELLENPQEKGKKIQAITLLEQILANGPVPVTDIQSAAKANGISWPTVQRAKQDAKNISADQAGKLRREGLLPDDGSPAQGWYWRKKPVAAYGSHH